MHSQYIFNGYIINPALAGFDGVEQFNITARHQWVGYDGNPKTYWLSYQNRILKKRFKLKGKGGSLGEKKKYVPKTSGRIGVGYNVFNDTYGIIRKTGGQGTYSYNIVLGRTGYHLSFGLTMMAYTMRIDPNKMHIVDKQDPYLNEMKNDRTFVPDFSTGVSIRNNHYFVGLSAGQLTQSAIKYQPLTSLSSIYWNGGDFKHYKPGRTYALIAGWHLYETADLDIVPSTLLKTTEYRFIDTASQNNNKFTLKAQIDLNLKVTIRDKFWIGFSYRSNNDIVGFMGFRLNRLFVSYAVDYPTTTLRLQNWCSHEISITYKTGNTDRRFKYRERF